MENMHIEATFEIGGWDEAPFDEAVGVAKLTRATGPRPTTATSKPRQRLSD